MVHINSKPLIRVRAHLSSLLLGLGAFVTCIPSSYALNVFACEPEYAALVTAIAPNANVYRATSAMQDPHLVQAKPSLIAKMRRADLAVCAGADLEVGWLPMLQMKAANPKVRSTELGMFFAADQVDTLDRRDDVDRSMGDVHAAGNPHVHLDPQRLLLIGRALTKRLQQLDPDSAADYQANWQGFELRWQQAIDQWQQQAHRLNGMRVIAYHSSFRYLFHWLGISQIADLEPKPGLPPTSGHLSSLLSKTQHADAIVLATYQDPRGGQWLAQRSELPILNLPLSIDGDEHSGDLFALYQRLIDLLLTVAPAQEAQS